MGEKVSIFALYDCEKVISHKDNLGQETELLLVKMTQRERVRCFEIFNEEKNVIKKRLDDDESINKTQEKALNVLTQEQLIKAIIDTEEAQQGNYADIYPHEEEKELSKEEKEKKKNELIEKWKKTRKSSLSELPITELRKTMLEISIDSLSTIDSGRSFDCASLAFMVRNAQSKECIFKDYKEVDNVKDRRVLEWLFEELKTFRKEEFDTDEKMIDEANSSSFLSNGGSQKPSEQTPDTKS